MYSLRLLVLSAVFSVTSCLYARADEAMHAELRSEVKVDGRTVTLGDIADLSGTTDDKLAALARTRLAFAPQPGYTLHITRREVIRLLHEASAPEVVVEGADGTIVTAASVVFDIDAAIELAKKRLTADLQRDGQALELVPFDDAPELRLPRGKVELRVRDQKTGEMRRRMIVHVDVLLDGSYYRTVPVTFSVNAVGPIFVARRDLVKGAVPGCSDLERQQREIAALASSPQAGDCANWQRRLKRDLAAGEVLLTGDTEATPTVIEGQYVTLKVAEGAVMIESRALALTDGELGQRIAVRPSMSEEPVMATVVAPGLVNLSER